MSEVSGCVTFGFPYEFENNMANIIISSDNMPDITLMQHYNKHTACTVK